MTVSADRCAKLIAEIDAFLEEGKQQTDVGRRDLAGLIGRLQWVAQVTDGGQLHLRRAYRARDAFVGDVGDTARARWGRGVRVERTTGLCLDLEWWRHELGQLAGRRLYLTNLAVVNGFWRGEIAEGDEQLDAAGGAAGEDVVGATTDASGYAGGAWTRLERAAWRFEDAIRAPNLSSNYRELLTAVLTLERWGAKWQGRRVLIRTDNTTTVRVLNTGDTGSPLLEPLARRLYEVRRRYDLDVSGRHIPGLKNALADALSRRRYDLPDSGDWQFARSEFERAEDWVAAKLGRRFDVDACADPTGQNAHCERFWSATDSCLLHDMGGEMIWCNADWELLPKILPHFRGAAARQPYDTAGVFAVPEKTNAAWWREVRGFRVLARYPAGTRLFTRPFEALTGLRETVQPAKWPVLLLWWEPASRTARARQECVSTGTGAGRLGANELLGLQLTGDGPLDAQRLRTMDMKLGTSRAGISRAAPEPRLPLASAAASSPMLETDSTSATPSTDVKTASAGRPPRVRRSRSSPTPTDSDFVMADGGAAAALFRLNPECGRGPR